MVQVHNIPDFLVFVALVPKMMGAKIILDLHDLTPEFYAERSGRKMGSRWVRFVCWQERMSCRFADKIITVTELWRETLIKRGQAQGKVGVVMNVADNQVFHPKAAIRTMDNTHFRLIYHGILGQRQGLDLLLRAICRVRNAAPDIQLTIHGWGEYKSALQELTAELGVQRYVEFSNGNLLTEELPRFLARADVAVVPYRNGVFSGGILPTKLMEYAALGFATIAARTPGITAYFDETSVQFFTPGDVEELATCILRLYHDRCRVAELAQKITAFNDRYNWERIGAGYAAFVEDLAAE